MSHRSQRSRAGQLAQRAALFAALSSACSNGLPPVFETDRGVYSERLDYEAVEQRLATLETHRTELYLAIGPDDVETGALESVLLAARRHGVPVRAWLRLDDGWPGEHDLEAFDAHVRAFWRWNRQAQLGVEWILVDMQGERPTAEELAASLPTLRGNRDPAAFEAARGEWAAAVDAWHDEGMSVAAVGLPYVLDDFVDGDADLQDMLDAPIDGIDWDEVGFQVYQELYGSADARLGAPLVVDYARTIAEHWGERGSIALGTIGGADAASSGYRDRAALEADLGAAAGAGLTRFQLSSLDGMERDGGVGEWIGGLAIEPATIPTSDTVTDVRAMIARLDE